MATQSNMTDPSIGAFPTTPLRKEVIASAVTPDDGGRYTDGGTQKTQELIAMFHHRGGGSPPRKPRVSGSSNSSPNRTESTFTGSSGASRFLSDDDDDDEPQQQLQHVGNAPRQPELQPDDKNNMMYITPPRRRTELPLLPERSDANSNPLNDPQEEEENDVCTSSVSVSTMSSVASSREGSYGVVRRRGRRPPNTTSLSQEDDTSPSASIEDDKVSDMEEDNEDDLFETKQLKQDASGRSGFDTRGQLEPNLDNEKELTAAEILTLQASLVSMRKVMSTLQGELRRRNSKQRNKSDGGTREQSRSFKQQTTKTRTRGLRFREHMECLILSDDNDDESFSSVPDEGSVEMNLASQMAQVVQNIPPCETANVLIKVRYDKESAWSITSAQVKSSSKRLDFV